MRIGWSVNIKSIQDFDSPVKCDGSEINWWRPLLDARDSKSLPLLFPMSFNHHWFKLKLVKIANNDNTVWIFSIYPWQTSAQSLLYSSQIHLSPGLEVWKLRWNSTSSCSIGSYKQHIQGELPGQKVLVREGTLFTYSPASLPFTFYGSLSLINV